MLVYTDVTDRYKMIRGLEDVHMNTYHGTEINRGKSMITNQKMEMSICSEKRQHWLGDGVYLYSDSLYAYRWIVQMYKARFQSKFIKSTLMSKYSILNVDIHYDHDRVFSMTNPEHYIIFTRCRDNCRNKLISTDYANKYKIVDPFIFNFMFKMMKYGNDFDMIYALFNLDRAYYSHETRFTNLPEVQICVKNEQIISDIRLINIDINEYDSKLDDFNSYRTTSNKYKTKFKRGV